MKSILKAWLVVMVLPCVACAALLGPKGQSLAMFTLKESACILDHDGEPFPAIVKDCNLVNASIEEVAQLLAAQKRAEMRHRAAAEAPSDAGCAPADARGDAR